MFSSSSSSNQASDNKKLFFEQLKENSANVIDVNSSDLTKEDLGQLVDILRQKQNVTELNLNFNELGDDVINAIIDLSQSNPNLTVIKCQYNNITDVGIIQLTEAAQHYATTLHKIAIDLSCNRITDAGLKNGVIFLSSATILTAISGNFIKDPLLIESFRKAALEKHEYESLADSKDEELEGSGQSNSLPPATKNERRTKKSSRSSTRKSLHVGDKTFFSSSSSSKTVAYPDIEEIRQDEKIIAIEDQISQLPPLKIRKLIKSLQNKYPQDLGDSHKIDPGI